MAKNRRFMLFGMGSRRRKLLYVEGGRLLDALTLETLRTWEPVNEELHAAEYRVILESKNGRRTVIGEDEEGVWLQEAGDRMALTTGCRVRLPRFGWHPYAVCWRHYPYLKWAEAHFYNDPPPEALDEPQPPITREACASEAEYWRLKALAREGVIEAEDMEHRICRPHTWHAAEMFLYLVGEEVAK